MATFIGIRSLIHPTIVFEKPQNRLRFDRTARKSTFFLALGASFCLLAVALVLPVDAQSADTDASTVAASASTASLIRWTGSLSQAAGRKVEITFSLYQNSAGGPALWSETQTVKVGTDGRYSVLLGATSAEGLPQTLFQAGEAQWIEARPVQAQLNELPSREAVTEVANASTHGRSLLSVVPYAFKSLDADSLAGRPATDYVTREDLQSTVASQVQATSSTRTTLSNETTTLPVVGTPLPILGSPSPISSSSSSGGTALNGVGTSGFLPAWTASATLGNSMIAQSGTNVGIGTAAPATMLDVNGASTLRGTVSLLATAATLAAGVNSPALQLGANSYSSTSNAAVPQNFVWQAASVGNNTATPSANLNLLFGAGDSAPAATGLSIAPSGQITFAPGQTFPGVSNSPGTGTGSSTITGVTAGSGLTGGGSSGNVTIALSGPISTANGGTGATTPAGALANMGGISSTQTAGQTMAGPLNAPSINDVLYAAQFPGSDIGAKINAALATCPLSEFGGPTPTYYPACTIVLPIANMATWSTPVVINSPAVSLVGQGSAASKFNCTMNGDCLRIYTKPFIGIIEANAQGGLFKGFSLFETYGTPHANGVGIHLTGIGYHLDDIVIENFMGTNGVALWLDNPDNTAWTERNLFTACEFGFSTKLIKFSAEGTSYSFGYNRMLDVRLNPVGAGTYGVTLEGGADVYNGTYRFTINHSGQGGSIFYVTGGSSLYENELHIFGEDNGGDPPNGAQYLWNAPSGTIENYGELSWLNTVPPPSTGFTPWWLSSNADSLASKAVTADGDVVLATGHTLSGVFAISWNSNNRIQAMILTVGANQYDTTSSLAVLSNYAYQRQTVFFNPRIVLDSNSQPQLVVAVGNRNGNGTIYVKQIGLSYATQSQDILFPSVAEGTTSTVQTSSGVANTLVSPQGINNATTIAVDTSMSAGQIDDNTGSANHVVCWKTATTLGVCSTRPTTNGSCTCK